jgi:3-deoxy-D-manno-octulosonate 8-phosphate phosphatase KdsC-like HAD superfamily phosphatase
VERLPINLGLKMSQKLLQSKNLGLSLNEVIAFGDDKNDVEMLNTAGLGFVSRMSLMIVRMSAIIYAGTAMMTGWLSG